VRIRHRIVVIALGLGILAFAVAVRAILVRRAVPSDVSAPIWGVTIDSVGRIDEIEPAIQGFRHRLTARIVFDPGTTSSDYRPAMVRIAKHAWIMAEICDSYYMKKMDLATFQAATREYYQGLHDLVNIWEVGNEVNGDWLGKNEDTAAKILYANSYIKARGGRTALTLYWDCRPEAWDEIWAWGNQYLPPAFHRNVDYVLLSVYCPSLADWGPIFRRLGTEYPGARVGFGEVGAEKENDKPACLRTYYGLKVDAPRYVGGYFWWFFTEDMLPKSKPMWKVLQEAIP